MRIYILVGVDEQQESIRLLLWSAQKWNDSGLKWNTSDFEGLKEINIPALDLWLPDWHIFNLVDSKDSVELSRTNARVNYKGEVAVDFYKIIKRKALFYIVTLIFPTYLIVTVSIIGLYVPHSAGGEREEKV
uniref:Neurotransmitter-gated ion-channel ligand-binding domain-containing protein n=1 Tax=Panagrolaimus sp. PS1159 TaxID=55785 RepID=A0AC35F442_9BILA